MKNPRLRALATRIALPDALADAKARLVDGRRRSIHADRLLAPASKDKIVTSGPTATPVRVRGTLSTSGPANRRTRHYRNGDRIYSD
jgi:hypothetical protein